jgi:flagellar biosynthetic protein FliP
MLRKQVSFKLTFVLMTLLLIAMCVMPMMAQAQGIPLVSVSGGKGGQQYSMSLQLLGSMTTLTLLPSMLLMMTSFVRIIIVLSILRQALGTAQAPPNTRAGRFGDVLRPSSSCHPFSNAVYKDASRPLYECQFGLRQSLGQSRSAYSRLHDEANP